jgi:hypothetical protein
MKITVNDKTVENLSDNFFLKFTLNSPQTSAPIIAVVIKCRFRLPQQTKADETGENYHRRKNFLIF